MGLEAAARPKGGGAMKPRNGNGTQHASEPACQSLLLTMPAPKPAAVDHTQHHIHPIIQQKILRAVQLRIELRKSNELLARAEAEINEELEFVAQGYDPWSENFDGSLIPLGSGDGYECPCPICKGR